MFPAQNAALKPAGPSGLLWVAEVQNRHNSDTSPTKDDTALNTVLQGCYFHHGVPGLSNKTCDRESQDNEFAFFFFFIPAFVANAVGNWLRPLFSVLYAPRELLTNPASMQVSGGSKTRQAEDKQIDIIRILNIVSETRAEIVKV